MKLRVHRDLKGLEAVFSGIIITLARQHAIEEYNSRANSAPCVRGTA